MEDEEIEVCANCGDDVPHSCIFEKTKSATTNWKTGVRIYAN